MILYLLLTFTGMNVISGLIYLAMILLRSLPVVILLSLFSLNAYSQQTTDSTEIEDEKNDTTAKLYRSIK